MWLIAGVTAVIVLAVAGAVALLRDAGAAVDESAVLQQSAHRAVEEHR